MPHSGHAVAGQGLERERRDLESWGAGQVLDVGRAPREKPRGSNDLPAAAPHDVGEGLQSLPGRDDVVHEQDAPIVEPRSAEEAIRPTARVQ